MGFKFSELYTSDFDIQDIFVMKQTFWRAGDVKYISPRTTEAFIMILNSEAICKSQGRPDLKVKEGDFLYVARDSSYTWYFDKEAQPLTLLFEFNLKDSEGNLVTMGDGINLINIGEKGVYNMLFEKLLHEYSRPNPFPTAIKIGAYSFLAEVIRRYRNMDIMATVESEEFYKGVRYLEDNTSQNKSVAEIAQMCNMSISTFEKQFKRYSGVTPIEYRTAKRLDRAEAMLKNGNMSINQIAEELGFYDGAYLCRLFKKKRGISPVAFRNIK